jgi:hypothetical protein
VSYLTTLTISEITQSNSERKVSILGGDSISQCEKKVHISHVSDGRWLPRESSWNLQIRTLLMVIKKPKLHTVNFILVSV